MYQNCKLNQSTAAPVVLQVSIIVVGYVEFVDACLCAIVVYCIKRVT